MTKLKIAVDQAIGWPSKCACCMGPSDRFLRVRDRDDRSWSVFVPYCRRCSRHARWSEPWRSGWAPVDALRLGDILLFLLIVAPIPLAGVLMNYLSVNVGAVLLLAACVLSLTVGIIFALRGRKLLGKRAEEMMSGNCATIGYAVGLVAPTRRAGLLYFVSDAYAAEFAAANGLQISAQKQPVSGPGTRGV